MCGGSDGFASEGASESITFQNLLNSFICTPSYRAYRARIDHIIYFFTRLLHVVPASLHLEHALRPPAGTAK